MQSTQGASGLNKQRLSVGFLLILGLFTLLVFRLAYWQIVRADDLHVKAAEMQKVDTALEPVRGAIYDANKKTLAQTVTEYELYGYSLNLYKSDALKEDEKEANVTKLAEITGKDADSIRKTMKGKDNLVKLAGGMDQAAVKSAQKTFGENIVVKTKVSRAYPNGAFAASLLGFVNEDNSGRVGLEYQYNSLLSGVKGRVVKTTDSQGNALANGSSKFYEAQDGCSVVTTVDEVIQHYVEDALAEGMEDTQAESITCIVMDPKTGNVLAMASTPSFDPSSPYKPSDAESQKAFKKMSTSDQSDYLSKMWTNPAVSGIYEPGSTFKLITAASALDSGTATDSSSYSCPGSINVAGTTLNCWSPTPHGTQNLTEAVGNSCNPALARVSLDMGRDNFYRYIRLFGFMNKTGIDLPGEGTSIVKDKNGLTAVDLATTGYGQGVAVTPLQILTAINALGNDGKLMRPKVVKQILDADGKVKSTVKDAKVRQVISRGTADKMRAVMEYYVTKGGGTSAYIPGYRVGGKTGTANIAEGGSYSEQTVASFVAMAPMDDPKVSILVMVTKPKKSIYGAANAGPIVKKILEKTLVYKGVERKYSSDEEAQMAKSAVSVPDVTGTDSQSAISKIKAAGLVPKAMPEGTSGSFHVIDQYPKAGDKASKGATVYLYSE